ncbi:MAG: TonB-dependent receptor [Acidobacteriia bacterium]|nr:TonB-dependent receptor [Terriglobia bacterium]
MKATRQIASIGAVLVFVLLMAGALRAQTATGQITGTVKDTTGAVMPDVKVTLSNQLTGFTREITTGASGDYAFPLLAVGLYSVTAEKQGFRVAKRSDIQLNVADVIRIDLELAIGALTQTVEVKASAVALDTETSAVTQLIGQRQVNELPLNSRNFVQFLLLGAGAVTTSGEQGGFREGKGDAISINGARPTSLNYMLDGLVNTDTALNTPSVILSQDAIQEFKEQTATYSAEYGFSANQINIISKSGTNELHGSVFEFLRNDAVDARNTFAADVPVLRQNQFGFVASGPVYIPKVYDGRNKTFWLANFEGWRIRRGSIQQGVVPPPAQLHGDFSASGLPAFGTAECAARLAANSPCMPVDPVTGLPFPGNKIDSSRFSRYATQTLALEGMIPAPNCDPAACAGNNYRVLANLPTTLNQQTYKGDQDLGRFGKVFGRFTKSNYVSTRLGYGISRPWYDANLVEDETSWMVSHSVTLGQRNVNNVRFGRLESTANTCVATPVPKSVVDALGLTGVFQNLDDCARGYPSTNALGQFSGFGGATRELSNIPIWEFADSFTTIRGKHTLAIGADYRQWAQNRDLTNSYLGSFNYNNDLIINNGGNGAKGCDTPYCGTGNAVADFLLGYYSTSELYQPGPFSKPGVVGNLLRYHFKYLSAYVQDDWKVSPRLTLNMGLRWDFRTIPFEADNKMGWLDVQNPDGGMCIADQELVTKGIAPAGSMYRYCGRRNPADASRKVFAPRFGFAFRPFGEKTVIRGGYGVFFDSAEGREIDDSGDIYPYAVRTTLTPATQPVESAPKLTDQLYPPYTTVSPVGPEKLTFIAVIISERPRNPYVQQWSLSVQRELFKDTKLEANYVGNKGLRLLTRTNIARVFDPSNPDFCAATDADGNPINLDNGDCPISTRKPLPNFLGSYIDSGWGGYSNYHSANVKLERQTSTLSLQAVYTWAKSLDNKSAAAGLGGTLIGWSGFMDDHRPQLDYGRSEFDVDHRFIANFVYQLPFGRGKQYLGSVNKAVDALLGGWQLSGIVTLQRGFPFSIYGADSYCLLDFPYCMGNRANQVGDPFPSGFKKTPEKWFDTSAFVSASAVHYGTSGRNILRGPGLNNWDLGLGKSFSFGERVRLQFRVETFNSFNHPQYNFIAPDIFVSNADVTSPTYGKVQQAHDGRIVQFGLKVLF